MVQASARAPPIALSRHGASPTCAADRDRGRYVIIGWYTPVHAENETLPMAATPGVIERIDQLPSGPLYVFGYGSLLWRPGFDWRAARRARIHGFHRALRVWSFHHRGTPDQPGLVLGLDCGGSCLGCMFEVDEAAKRPTAEYLWAREMVTSVYIPRLVHVHCDGDRFTALTFVLDRDHEQYAGTLAPDHAARHILDAQGASGANPEYVRETVAGLERLGVCDRGLRSVLHHLERPDRD